MVFLIIRLQVTHERIQKQFIPIKNQQIVLETKVSTLQLNAEVSHGHKASASGHVQILRAGHWAYVF